MQLLQYLKSAIFLRTIIMIVVSLVIGIFMMTKLLNIRTNHGQKIEVPDLSKMTTAEAYTTLNKIKLDTIVLDYASFNPEYPPLSVVDQNPEPGDFVKEGRKIYLTLNPASYRKIAIPDVLGKTKRQVVTQLTSAGFKIGISSYVPDIGRDVVRKLKFDGKELKIGDMIPKNSTINLVLGDGKLGNDPDDN